MRLKDNIESHIPEVFSSKPGLDVWNASAFALHAAREMRERLARDGFTSVRGTVEVWPYDSADTEHIDEAEQVVLTVQAAGHRPYRATLDFKTQVDFTGRQVVVEI